MTNPEQGELFTPPAVQKSALDEFLENRYPVIVAIGVPFGKFSGLSYPFVRVTTKDGAGVHYPGSGFTSQWTDKNIGDFNYIEWKQEQTRNDCTHSGFIQAVTTFRENSKPILHMLYNVTDLYGASSAIALEDIEKVEMYPDNTARVIALYQNAEVDGEIRIANHETKTWDRFLTFAQVAVYADEFMPQPEVVFDVTQASEGSGN